MRIRRLHRIFALSMAFLMLGVSAGFSADFHYCQGEFKNFALYKKAKSCHELAAMKASCHMKSDEKTSCHSAKVKCESEEENGCCENDTKLIQLDEDFAFGSSSFDVEVEHNFYLHASANVYEVLENNYKLSTAYLNYKPPLIIVEKTILFQTFRC